MKEMMKKLGKYVRKKKLEVNVEKTKMMVFNKRKEEEFCEGNKAVTEDDLLKDHDDSGRNVFTPAGRHVARTFGFAEIDPNLTSSSGTSRRSF
ncbi:hypothetical protein GEV33_011059 [Tenebrio molitor]|uniref:Uncharacterized protein n=1 Tax=Tenebrio molitor TaxID=7067 RepID=A0A8J6LA39_TENMO|nr:hypothetical protein GEV33_011059 [Tenebrio molitor]